MLRFLKRLLSPLIAREPIGSAAAAVFRRGPRLAVHSHVRNTDGILISSEPYIPLPGDADAFAVGEAVIEALRAYRSGVDRSARDKNDLTPLFKALGVRSWRSLMDGSALCEVWKDDRYEVMPTRNGGTHGDERGFQHLLGESVYLDLTADAGQLGEAILRCLDRCR